MTEKLKTLMREQADSVDFDGPDLDAMIATGDRRVRHRRLGAVAGIAALVAGIALVAPVLAPGEQAVEPAGPVASDAAPLSWVDGTTLHEGDRAYELGFRPRAYVRTAEGYVFSDRDGKVWSWIDGVATGVGRTDRREPHLVADQETGLAGWLDLADGIAYAVIDQTSGDTSTFHFSGLTRSSRFFAIDEATAYVEDGQGPAAYDVGSGARRYAFRPDGRVLDIEDAYVAVRREDGIALQTVANRQVTTFEEVYGEVGTFSPDVRYFSSDADEPQVFDIASGEPVVLDVGDHTFATGYEWLGNHTLAVIAATETGDAAPAALLTCDMTDGRCAEVADLGDLSVLEADLLLPVGEPMG